MKSMNPYLNFNGNCRQAVEFYQKCLGADLEVMLFSEAPCATPEDQKDRIMHARLSKGSIELMASDTMSSAPIKRANNFSINIYCESAQEIETLFAAFSEGGSVTMPLQDMFWGARFGTLTDQFGIHWMFNYFLPKNGDPR
jgi:PhnB protein